MQTCRSFLHGSCAAAWCCLATVSLCIRCHASSPDTLFASDVITPVLCRCIRCGEVANDPPCNVGRPCNQGLVPSEDSLSCRTCGGIDEPVCCNSRFCSDSRTDRACDPGLTRARVQVEEIGTVAEFGVGATCVEPPQACGRNGTEPCGEEAADDACAGRLTPSQDYLTCIPCGALEQPPCMESADLCDSGLEVLRDSEEAPELCVTGALLTQALEAALAPGAVLDQSGGAACGLAGQPVCRDPEDPDRPACVGRTTIVVENGSDMCRGCGSADQPECTGDNVGDPCDPGFHPEGGMCVSCGYRGGAVCSYRPYCLEGLENVEGFCQTKADAEAEAEVEASS